MNQSIILGIGTGRCGTASLAKILHLQHDAQCSYEEPPFLPWKPAADAERVIRSRFARFRSVGKKRLLGDVASFYLPYVEQIIAQEPDVRIVCLKRPREDVVMGFCELLDQTMPLPTNHWTSQLAPGWHQDPVRTRLYPQYDIQNREEGIRRYWDEYHQRVQDLVGRYPEHIRLFDTYEALNTEAGQRDLLGFVGIPAERQVLAVGTNIQRAPERPQERKRRPARRASGNPMDPRRCVILVPFSSSILQPCERALDELERRGYEVRRVGGYAAIDQGRNQMATDALLDGYEETMWIDADEEFHPDAIDRLRSHNLPIVTGICAQKGKRAIASHIMPGTPRMVFGKEGGLVEILYAGAGFLYVRREVYLAIQERLGLPMCNERFGTPMLPFFHPMLHACEDGHWYLAEDYAFCQRARQCGFKIMADTTIRIWHFGSQAYGWEDAGTDRPRFDTFVLNFGPSEEVARTDADGQKEIMAEFARQHAWPEKRPEIPPFPQRDWQFPGVQEVLALAVSPKVKLIVELGSWTGQSTRHLANLAPLATIIAIDPWQGGPAHQADPELASFLPRLYNTFLAECWGYRTQIVPVRAEAADGLQRVAQAGLKPDVVYIDGNHNVEGVLRDLKTTLDMFPDATVVGRDCDGEGGRAAVESLAKERNLKYEVNQMAWRVDR